MEHVLQDHQIRYTTVGWEVGEFLLLHGSKKLQKLIQH